MPSDTHAREALAASKYQTAIYNEIPFPLNATIIRRGITHISVESFSIKIFFTAGSSSQAIDAVHPATIIDKSKDKKILSKCFRT